MIGGFSPLGYCDVGFLRSTRLNVKNTLGWGHMGLLSCICTLYVFFVKFRQPPSGLHHIIRAKLRD